MPRSTPQVNRRASPRSPQVPSVEQNTPIDITLPMKHGRKRKSVHLEALPPGAEVVDLTEDVPKRVTKKAKSSLKDISTTITPERRARKYRAYPPRSFLERLERIRFQRMFILGHTVGGTQEVPEISFDIVGTTGNIYKTLIDREPRCNCPDGLKGNQCKHICYVLIHALKAPSHLQYQLAFLTSELREIYEGSPLSKPQSKTDPVEEKDGKRKPVEGDCPICFMEFEAEEDIVWCKAACGNNIHKACFERWAATTRRSAVRCVYCRTPWEFEESTSTLESLQRTGTLGADGYVNVAAQFGLSGRRDYSIYSTWSTARQIEDYYEWS